MTKQVDIASQNFLKSFVNMKLLLRREIDITTSTNEGATADTADVVPIIIASLYRRSVDGAYQQLVGQGAEAGVFDCFFMDCVKLLLDQGMLLRFIRTL